MTPAFSAGIEDALRKLAALDTTVNEVVTTILKTNLKEGTEPGPDDDLETLLPDDGALEAVVAEIEDNFDVTLKTDDVFALFAGGTVGHLESAIVDAIKAKPVEKKADYNAHTNYMRNRARNQQRSRQYRMRNLHQIRRKSRIYRGQVNRGARRQRKRMGSAAGGFTFVTT